MLDISTNEELNSDFLRAANRGAHTFTHGGQIYTIIDKFLTDSGVNTVLKNHTKKRGKQPLNFIINNGSIVIVMTPKEYMEFSHENYISYLKKYVEEENIKSHEELVSRLRELYSNAMYYRRNEGKVPYHPLLEYNPTFNFENVIEGNAEIERLAEKMSETIGRNFSQSSNLGNDEDDENTVYYASKENLDKAKLLEIIKGNAGLAVLKNGEESYLYSYDKKSNEKFYIPSLSGGIRIDDNNKASGFYVNLVQVYKQFEEYGRGDLYIESSEDKFDLSVFFGALYKVRHEKGQLIFFKEDKDTEDFDVLCGRYTGKEKKFAGVKLTMGPYIHEKALENILNNYNVVSYRDPISKSDNK